MIMIAVVRIDSISGDNSPANQAKYAERDDAGAMRELKPAANGVLEQDGSDQEQQRPADRAQHRLEVGMAGRMRQHQFIGDRRQNDAGHDRHMQIGVGQPRQPARLAGF